MTHARSEKDDLDEMIAWELYSAGGQYRQEYVDEMRRKVREALTLDPYETNRRLLKIVSEVPLSDDVACVSPIRFTIRYDPLGAYAVLHRYIDRFDEAAREGISYNSDYIRRSKGRAELWIELHPWLANERRVQEIISFDNKIKQRSWSMLGDAIDCALAGDMHVQKIGSIEYAKYFDAIRDNAPWIGWFLYNPIQEHAVGELEVLPVFEIMKDAAPECIAPIARHYHANLIFRGANLYEELKKLGEGKRDASWMNRYEKLNQILQRIEELDDYKKRNTEIFVSSIPEISLENSYILLIEEAFRELRCSGPQ